MLIYTRRSTGRPPGDVNPKAGGFPGQLAGNGWKQAQIQGEIDFNQLGLPNLYY